MEAKVRRQLEKLAHLRARGPLSTDYSRWVDETLAVLGEAFGEGSPQAQAFVGAVGERGVNDAFGLPLEGPWGLWERLERGEAILRQLLGQPAASGPQDI